VGKLEGKRLLESRRRTLEDNIKTDLKKWYWKEWPGMAKDRDRWQIVLNAVMNIRVPKNVGDFLTGSSWTLLYVVT